MGQRSPSPPQSRSQPGNKLPVVPGPGTHCSSALPGKSSQFGQEPDADWEGRREKKRIFLIGARAAAGILQATGEFLHNGSPEDGHHDAHAVILHLMQTGPRLAALAAALGAAGHGASGHGAVVHPRPRNAVGADLLPWSGGVPTPIPFSPWCPIPLRSAAVNDKRNLSGANGQACYWFSNGCAIGCDSCDGSTRGPIPKFVLAADGRYVVCSRFLPI